MFKGIKAKFAAALAVITTITASLVVSADPAPGLNISDAIGAGMQEVSSQVMSVIGTALPIIMGVVGAVIAITLEYNPCNITMMDSLI